MSPRPAGPLDEAEQIHAILKPRFTASGAGERRRLALATAGSSALPWSELDALIDGLLTRMRVDPRPTQQRSRTRESTRPPIGPPPVPVSTPSIPVPPLPADASPTRRVAERVPPPLPPLPSLSESPKLPGGFRPPADELEAPPLPSESKPRKSTASLPVVSAEDVAGALIMSRPGTSPETHLLYDDIILLSTIGDRDGVVISLERLLVLAKLEDHVRLFVESHEVKLMSLLEASLKSFSLVPKRKQAAVENTMPRVFLRGEKIAGILPLIDGKATIAEIIRKSSLTPVETCAVVSQLKRSGLIDV
jgi:hypothetical protein